ncbi:MAG: hypothetical protein WKF82_11025 [Nocardioidaceae bacterium]
MEHPDPGLSNNEGALSGGGLTRHGWRQWLTTTRHGRFFVDSITANMVDVGDMTTVSGDALSISAARAR